MVSKEPCRDQAGEGGIVCRFRSSEGIARGSNVVLMGGGTFTGLLELALDLILGALEGALGRPTSEVRSSALSLERLRGEEELPDDNGDTGRSTSFRRLSLATLKVADVRGPG